MNDSIHFHIQTRLLVIASACHKQLSAAAEPYASMKCMGLLSFSPLCK